MKPQQELYQALRAIDKVLSDGVIINLLNDIDRKLVIISDTATTADTAEDFTDSALEIIRHYSALCEEIIADVQVATFGIKNRVAKALEEEDGTE